VGSVGCYVPAPLSHGRVGAYVGADRQVAGVNARRLHATLNGVRPAATVAAMHLAGADKIYLLGGFSGRDEGACTGSVPRGHAVGPGTRSSPRRNAIVRPLHRSARRSDGDYDHRDEPRRRDFRDDLQAQADNVHLAGVADTSKRIADGIERKSNASCLVLPTADIAALAWVTSSGDPVHTDDELV